MQRMLRDYGALLGNVNAAQSPRSAVTAVLNSTIFQILLDGGKVFRQFWQYRISANREFHAKDEQSKAQVSTWCEMALAALLALPKRPNTHQWQLWQYSTRAFADFA